MRFTIIKFDGLKFSIQPENSRYHFRVDRKISHFYHSELCGAIDPEMKATNYKK